MKTFIKNTLLIVLLFLVLVVPCFAEQLTPEQKAEDKVMLYIVKETNKQIPRNTIVTNLTTKAIENQIEAIIIKAGYSKKEFSIKTAFCPVSEP